MKKSLNINFDESKLINKIKKTIDSNEYYGEFYPRSECEDRYHKVDAHSIFSVALIFSSEYALKNGNNILSSIGQYYSFYHLSFALITLDMNIKNEQLNKMKHNTLKKHIKNFIDRKIISKEFLYIFDDLKEVREHFNYLNVGEGSNKIDLL